MMADVAGKPIKIASRLLELQCQQRNESTLLCKKTLSGRYTVQTWLALLLTVQPFIALYSASILQELPGLVSVPYIYLLLLLPPTVYFLLICLQCGHFFPFIIQILQPASNSSSLEHQRDFFFIRLSAQSYSMVWNTSSSCVPPSLSLYNTNRKWNCPL